jgi:sphingomyelin phosphodiesterase acid-like 3
MIFRFIAFIPFFIITACAQTSSPVQVSPELDIRVPNTNHFLFISDIHLNTFGPGPSAYGEDTQMDLWAMAKAKLMSQTHGLQRPEFIIYTGDLPDHTPDNGADHDTNIRTVLNELLDIAGDIPLFYAPGNNDPRGGDYHPFLDASCETPLDLARANSGYPAPNADTIYTYDNALGYYSARPFKGLRIIALNSVMFSSSHDSVYPDHCISDTLNQDQESSDQLNWLKGELADAKAQNEKVYLIMHIPPGRDAYSGKSMWKDGRWTDSLLTYANQYSSTISGLFYGHTHMDEVRRLSVPGDTSLFSVVAISAPGISPKFKNNPGFKNVHYNTAFEPVNFETFYTEEVNGVWGVADTSWGNKSYTFKDIYGPGTTIKQVISDYPIALLYQHMINFYMVKSAHSSGSSHIQEGISVK